jgi:DNA-binding Xre family transcriptional regulator
LASASIPNLRTLISPAALDGLMTARRVTNAELAEVAGCTRANIGHLRTGLVKRTTATRARAIESYLQATRPLFMGDPTSSASRPDGERPK